MARVPLRKSWCWACKRDVSTPLNDMCQYCGWLACWWCGSCEVHRDDDGNLVRMCRATAWARSEVTQQADHDARGEPILTALPPAADADVIGRLLHQAGIDRIYHWSPLRSARSILGLGILSPAELDRRDIKFVPHGYGSRDKAVLLWGYVALSFFPKFQMMRSWSETPVLYEVSPHVLLTSGALFVPGNSASVEFPADSIGLMVGAPWAEELLGGPGHAPPPQSEAWVPRRVPRAAIARVLVHDQDAQTDLLNWLRQHPEVRVPEIALLDPTSLLDGATRPGALGTANSGTVGERGSNRRRE
jgi:hypothetical protein